MGTNKLVDAVAADAITHQAVGVLATLLDVTVEQAADSLALRARFADLSLDDAAQQVLDEQHRRVGDAVPARDEGWASVVLQHRLDEAASPSGQLASGSTDFEIAPAVGRTPSVRERAAPLATSRAVVLGGPLQAPGAAALIDYCDQLHVRGVTRLHVDMSAVTDCDRAGLNGLHVLVSGTIELAVHIDGARWKQFLIMLSTAPIADLQGLCDLVRKIRGTSVEAPRIDGREHRPGRHRRG